MVLKREGAMMDWMPNRLIYDVLYDCILGYIYIYLINSTRGINDLNSSNKSATRCNNFSSLLSWHLFTAQHVSGVLTPIIRSSTTAVAASGFWFYLRSVVIAVLLVVVGPGGPTSNPARLSPRYEGKTRGCHCSQWAPNDGRENARNMLSCKQTSGL